MDRDEHGGREISWESSHKSADSVDTAGRGADDDDVAGSHAHLDAGSSASTATGRSVFAGNTRPLESTLQIVQFLLEVDPLIRRYHQAGEEMHHRAVTLKGFPEVTVSGFTGGR